MLLFGHIGFAIFLSTLFYLPALFSLIGVLLPDLVDKTLFVAGFTPCSRFFAHSIFFGPIVSLSVLILTKKKRFALAILFGSLLHLIEDLEGFIPWFYPLINYTFVCPPTLELHIGLFEIITEFVGLGLLLFTIKFNSKLIYLRNKIWSR